MRWSPQRAGGTTSRSAIRSPAAHHRDFREALEIEIERALRYQRRLSIAIFDIDEFTRLNSEAVARMATRPALVASAVRASPRRPDLASPHRATSSV